MSTPGPHRKIPPVLLQIAPSEHGTVLYQRLAPASAGMAHGAMLFLILTAKNQTSATITAREMTISFPGTAYAPVLLSSRDVEIGPGKQATVAMDGTEAISLPANAASTVQVSIQFDGLDQAVVQTWPLAPHATTYDFFAKPEDGAQYGEFVMMPGIHDEGGASQHFAYDVHVLGVNTKGNLSETRAGSRASNSDFFLWGRPVYAMADGVVLRAVDEHVDNPGPGQRTVTRKASWEGTQSIGNLAIANLSPQSDDTVSMSRMLTASVSDGNLRVAVLEQNADASQLQHLSGTVGPAASGAVSVAGISETRAVTAHVSGNDVRLTLWAIASNGSSITLKHTKTVVGITNPKLVKLTNDSVALLGRASGGDLSLTLQTWKAGAAPGSLEFRATPLASATGGRVKNIDLVRLSPTRVAAAVQTLTDRLKLIVWDITDGIGGFTSGTGDPTLDLDRVGEQEGQGTIQEVAIASGPVPDSWGEGSSQVVTAGRTSDGHAKLIAWEITAAGSVVRRGEVTEAEGESIGLSFFKTKAYALGFRMATGK